MLHVYRMKNSQTHIFITCNIYILLYIIILLYFALLLIQSIITYTKC